MNTLYRPHKFFLITYAVTFVSWAAAAYCSYLPNGEAIFVPFLIPGMVAPFAVALVMVLTSKSKELKALFRSRLLDLKRIRPLALLPMLLLMPAAILLSAWFSTAFFGQPAGQLALADEFSFAAGAVPVLIILILAATFEELGWRGYAFDALTHPGERRLNLFQATLAFSVLWAAWHIPLFFVNGYYHNEIIRQNPLFGLNFLVSVVPMAFILTWAWKANRESIPAVIFLHFFTNLCQEGTQITQVTKCVETGVLFLFAAAIVLLNRSLFFGNPDVQPEPTLTEALA